MARQTYCGALDGLEWAGGEDDGARCGVEEGHASCVGDEGARPVPVTVQTCDLGAAGYGLQVPETRASYPQDVASPLAIAYEKTRKRT